MSTSVAWSSALIACLPNEAMIRACKASQKRKVLNEYNFINRIAEIVLDKYKTTEATDFITELYSSEYFWKTLIPFKTKLKRTIKRKLRLG